MRTALFALLAVLAACDDKAPPAKPSATATIAAPVKPPPIATTEVKKSVAPTKDCSGKDVVFDEPVMEKAIRTQLQKPEGTIAKADLAKVKTLNISEAKKNDFLDPCIIPELKGLKSLYLGPGTLEDISLVKNLIHLESLRVSISHVKDLTPIAGLTKLDRLDLGRTPVSDLTPLEKLVNLTEVMLDDTEVSDISPLKGATKLQVLSLKNTRVKDLSPLRDHKELKSLNITGSLVTDITPVSGLTPKLLIQQQ
jgi:internalin A